MRRSANDRIVAASMAVVALMLSASLGILLNSGSPSSHAIASSGESPFRFELEGAVVVSSVGEALIVRALSLEPAVEIRSDRCRPVPCALRVENLDGENVQIRGLPESATVSRDTGAVEMVMEVDGTARISFSPGTAGEALESDGTPPYFLVIGDTHGRYGVVDAMIENNTKERPLFALHAGDMTSEGNESHILGFASRFAEAGIPLFATAGNHDLAGGGTATLDIIAPPFCSFSYGGTAFILFRSGPEGVDNEVLGQIKEALDRACSRGEDAVLVTHVPPFEPLGIDHSFLDGNFSKELAGLLSAGGADVLFCGHFHLFNHTAVGGMECFVTGGGGGSLYAPASAGGYWHYLRASMASGGMDVVSVRVNVTEAHVLAMTVVKGGRKAIFDFTSPPPISSIQGESSYENQYGFVRGEGVYEGYALSEIAFIVGGMLPGERMVVTATDGYSVDLSYGNIHPNATWLEVQGPLIIAYSYEGSCVPEWADGPRIVCLPEDGLFSNADAEATTPPGSQAPVSAGAIWVRNVARIEIVP